jgi:diacylglycerol kinase (ATP)
MDANDLKGKSGLTRLVNACKYSRQGILAAWKSEEAFRQELTAGLVLIPVALLLPAPFIYRLAAIGSLLILLIVELLNSGIEACIDRIGPEIHPKSGFAKDVGSAAVLFAIANTVLVWCALLWNAFF